MSDAESIRAVALTSGRLVPSRRYRVAQFVEPLRPLGVDLEEHVAPIPRSYIPAWARPRKVTRRAAQAMLLGPQVIGRTSGVVASRAADLTIVEREFVPGLTTLEPFVRSPVVVDLDDAIWTKSARAERAIQRLVRRAEVTWSGNDYIADWVRASGGEALVLPTAVQAERYKSRHDYSEGSRLGWVGTSPNLVYLEPILGVLDELHTRTGIRLVVIADALSAALGRRPYVDFLRWSPDIEYTINERFDIGIMPMPPGDWAEGKCGFKALQYMAAGLPVVVSPTRMTRGLEPGAVLAGEPADWALAISQLILSEPDRRFRGRAGRAIVEAGYSVDVVAAAMAESIRSVVRPLGERRSRGRPQQRRR